MLTPSFVARAVMLTPRLGAAGRGVRRPFVPVEMSDPDALGARERPAMFLRQLGQPPVAFAILLSQFLEFRFDFRMRLSARLDFERMQFRFDVLSNDPQKFLHFI